MNKLNILPILKGHLNTLQDFRNSSLAIPDLLTFFGLPCIVGVVLVMLKFGFRVDAVSGFLNTFSILTGLLLNLLVLVFTLASAAAPMNMDLRMRKIFLRQIFANICFSILISIAVVVTALISLAYMRSNQGAVTGPAATFVLSSFTASFVLTLLMVIKRMYVLLGKELDTSRVSRRDAA